MGQVFFVFPDLTVKIGAYLYNKTDIIRMANEAVANFRTLVSEYYKENRDERYAYP
jgi:hypothetical protein